VEDDDQFSVSVAPASALPHDPAGRQEMIQQLLASQIIRPETAKQLLGWSDLDSEMTIENAEFEYIDSLIERYLDAEQESWDESEYEAPEGFIGNKFGALRRFASAWFRGKVDQQALPPDERIKAEFPMALLTRYIKELDRLMQPPPAPPGPPPGAMGPPGAPPMAPPAAPPMAA
jgi:hypothetical protein